MSAVRSGASPSAKAAAATYKMSKSTLLWRLKGKASHEDWSLSNKKLTSVEEDVLNQDIIRLDSQGLSFMTALVQAIANSICEARRIPPVSKNWTSTFIKRSLLLTIKLGRTYKC